LPLAAFVLVAVAILGYAAGYRRAPAASPKVAHRETMHTVAEAGVLLEYPSAWQPVKALAAVPGLPISHALLLAPAGDPARAGLLAGELPSDEPSPLPARFLSLLRGAPDTEVVNLIDGQAFRYSHLDIPRYERALDLYVILYAGRTPAALACYAPQAASSAYLSQCEQIVAGLTPLGQSSTYDLTPDTSYARQLGTLVEGLNRERLALRGAMHAHPAPAAMGGFAATLADRFAAAASSLALLEAPPVAGPMQAALAGSMLHARDTYRSLSEASIASSAAGYSAALTRVQAAEAGVDRALEDFALLGYSRA
jgi:hypothetical protein